MKNLKILSITGSNASVIFTLEDDSTSTQTIASPVGDVDEIQSFLKDYGEAYEAGVSLAISAPAEVRALIGRDIDPRTIVRGARGPI